MNCTFASKPYKLYGITANRKTKIQEICLEEGNGGYGHWKGTSESNIDPHPMCELPTV